MAHFVLNMIQPVGVTPTPEELGSRIGNMITVNQQMQEQGVWVFGQPLAQPELSSVVRSVDGSVTVTEGPFAETKEFVGGFTLIDVPDVAAAQEWAAKLAEALTLPIEVRPAPTLG